MHDDLQQITQQTDASISTIHHVLRAPRRRLIILFLARQAQTGTESNQSSNSMTARNLAKWIVATEESTPREQATGDKYHNAYTAVTQVHLPHLHDVGVIQYDADRKTVEAGPNLRAFATIASVTSPLTRHLFNRELASLYQRGHEHEGEPQSPIEDNTS